jgi:hypothetical protein
MEEGRGEGGRKEYEEESESASDKKSEEEEVKKEEEEEEEDEEEEEVCGKGGMRCGLEDVVWRQRSGKISEREVRLLKKRYIRNRWRKIKPHLPNRSG